MLGMDWSSTYSYSMPSQRFKVGASLGRELCLEGPRQMVQEEELDVI